MDSEVCFRAPQYRRPRCMMETVWGTAFALMLVLACGRVAAEPAGPAPADRCGPGVPRSACVAPGVRICDPGAADRSGEWRFALVGPPFEPTLDVPLDRLRVLWRDGAIAASAETRAALGASLGPAGASSAPTWSILPVGELDPRPAVITVEGAHPLLGPGPLVVPLCGGTTAVTNWNPAHLTTLVMSGTTALTGRTAERIDDHGIADTVRYIQPFFASADLVHVSNEVAFVKDCKPRTGQKELIFCARDRYIALLEALGVSLVELTGSHLTDYGHRSLERTIDMYEARGWQWYGGGRTQVEATAPRIVEHHGNRLAFVGCNAVNWWINAIGPGSGTADCDWPRLVWTIQDLRRRGFTPIATVQHRELRTHTPAPDLVRDLRSLAEAGAVFVEGSQAHVAHPWDVHHGGYVHYGPGNILFAQYRDLQRDATVDKLFVYEGKLITVAHLYTRTEHGQPRPQSDRERTKFLGALARAAQAIAPADPTAAAVIPPATRVRPDSVVVGGRAQHLSVTVPAVVDPAARYRLVVDLDLTHGSAPDAFVVVRTGKAFASGEEIERYMRAKYPIAAAAATITPAPERIVVTRAHRRRSRIAAR